MTRPPGDCAAAPHRASVYDRSTMTCLLPAATSLAFALSLPLPLRWWTLATSALTIGGLTLAAIRRAQPIVTGAALAPAIAAFFMLSYAAVTLARPGAAGRLGYPFLVATGLRLDGGAWLVLLCGLVGLVPALVRERSA